MKMTAHKKTVPSREPVKRPKPRTAEGRAASAAILAARAKAVASGYVAADKQHQGFDFDVLDSLVTWYEKDTPDYWLGSIGEAAVRWLLPRIRLAESDKTLVARRKILAVGQLASTGEVSIEYPRPDHPTQGQYGVVTSVAFPVNGGDGAPEHASLSRYRDHSYDFVSWGRVSNEGPLSDVIRDVHAVAREHGVNHHYLDRSAALPVSEVPLRSNTD